MTKLLPDIFSGDTRCFCKTYRTGCIRDKVSQMKRQKVTKEVLLTNRQTYPDIVSQTKYHRQSITDEGLFGEASMTAPRCCCFIYQLSENGFWHLVLKSTLSNLAGHIVGTVCIVLFNNCSQYFVHCTFRHLCARVPLFLPTNNQRLMGLHRKSATGDSSWKGSGRFLKHFQDLSTKEFISVFQVSAKNSIWYDGLPDDNGQSTNCETHC